MHLRRTYQRYEASNVHLASQLGVSCAQGVPIYYLFKIHPCQQQGCISNRVLRLHFGHEGGGMWGMESDQWTGNGRGTMHTCTCTSTYGPKVHSKSGDLVTWVFSRASQSEIAGIFDLKIRPSNGRSSLASSESSLEPEGCGLAQITSSKLYEAS